MTEFVIPPDIVANEAEWSLLDFSGIQQSPLSGAVRTVSRGQRLQARLMWHDLVTDERAALTALIARVRGRANRLWVPDPTYRQRGSFPTGELFSNPTFNTNSGWSAYGLGNMKAGNREMQLISTSTSSQGLFQNITLDAAVAYILRSCIVDGAGTNDVTFRSQWSNGATNFLLTSASLRGMYRNSGVSNAFGSWAVFPMLYDTNAQIGDVAICQYASLSRCALVVNPSAATCFNNCLIDALPFSTAGLLLAGDKVEINGEFKTVISDVNSDSIGSAQLMFEPAMRVPIIPDNSPVVIFNPMMRGVLAEDAISPTRPGPNLFSDFSLTLTEA